MRSSILVKTDTQTNDTHMHRSKSYACREPALADNDYALVHDPLYKVWHWYLSLFSDAAFIAGIRVSKITGTFHFDKAILNPGSHFKPSDDSYVVPYDGLYQFTVAYWSYRDAEPKFYLKVDGVKVAYMRNYANTDHENSLILTRNLHLVTGEVITIDVTYSKALLGAHGGYESWFTGHLIYAD